MMMSTASIQGQPSRNIQTAMTLQDGKSNAEMKPLLINEYLKNEGRNDKTVMSTSMTSFPKSHVTLNMKSLKSVSTKPD